LAYSSIIQVTGNCQINSSITLSGYGTFVINGSVSFRQAGTWDIDSSFVNSGYLLVDSLATLNIFGPGECTTLATIDVGSKIAGTVNIFNEFSLNCIPTGPAGTLALLTEGSSITFPSTTFDLGHLIIGGGTQIFTAGTWNLTGNFSLSGSATTQLFYLTNFFGHVDVSENATLNVGGEEPVTAASVTFSSTASYAAGVPSNTPPILSVSGTALLDGNLVVNSAASWNQGVTILVFEAGNIVGTFQTLSIPGANKRQQYYDYIAIYTSRNITILHQIIPTTGSVTTGKNNAIQSGISSILLLVLFVCSLLL